MNNLLGLWINLWKSLWITFKGSKPKIAILFIIIIYIIFLIFILFVFYFICLISRQLPAFAMYQDR